MLYPLQLCNFCSVFILINSSFGFLRFLLKGLNFSFKNLIISLFQLCHFLINKVNTLSKCFIAIIIHLSTFIHKFLEVILLILLLNWPLWSIFFFFEMLSLNEKLMYLFIFLFDFFLEFLNDVSHFFLVSSLLGLKLSNKSVHLIIFLFLK